MFEKENERENNYDNLMTLSFKTGDLALKPFLHFLGVSL